MIRLGWKRFLIISVTLTGLSLPLGIDAVGIAFFLIGIASVVALIQAARHYQPRSAVIWYLFAVSLGLFLAGGVAETLTIPVDPEVVASYPSWREPFDFGGYLGFIFGIGFMARARGASRDGTITVDALISMGGVGALAWAIVMSSYLQSDQLTTAGKAVGVAFTTVSLLLGLVTVRVAIGPGARPTSYRFLSAAVAGAFASEIFIELDLSGRVEVPGFEMLTTLTSALAVIMVAAAALHPSMGVLTEPPTEVTPRMTGRRLVAMTFAVLIPPVLLLNEPTRTNNVEAIAIITVWAALSVMVMVRIYSLARTREWFAELDRTLATAEASLAAAANKQEMTAAVLDAAVQMIDGLDAAAIHAWEDGAWSQLGVRGATTLPPTATRPMSTLTEQAVHDDDTFRMDVHFEAVDVRTGVLTIAAPNRPDSAELARLSLLVADLARALESAAMREELGRARSERRFRALVENSADIIVVIDADGVVRFVSPAGPRLLGRSEDEIVDHRFADFVDPEHLSLFQTTVGRPGGLPVELQMISGDGTVRWFDLSTADMRAEVDIDGLVVTASEVSAKKQAQLDLERSEARFRSLVQHSSDLVAVLDQSGIISWISPSASRVLGVDPSRAVDHSVLSYAHPGDRDDLTALISSISTSPGEVVSDYFDLRLEHAEGGWRTLEVTVTNLLDDPSVTGIVLNAHDVTDRKNLEESLRHQALHDDLTGMANRIMFRTNAEEILSAGGEHLAVLMIDIDDFKTVNDGLGHTIGDELLKVLANRLNASIRGSDVAARLGGDEFAVLIGGAKDRAEVLSTAKRLLQTIQEPMVVSGREIVLHASVGVAFTSDVTQPTPEIMLRSADLAMYGAKSRGKSRVTVFDESMHEGVFERLELKADLARALERRELLLHYQPVVDLASGSIAGFEALMRWQHPDRGMVGPGTFIPLAEETGLIVPIGRWLLDVALAQLKQWQDQFPSREPLTMAINVSGRQLEEESIVTDLREAIARAGVPPSSVVVELTESMVVEDAPDLVRRLEEIRAIGVGLYADDFGSGFASYAALQSLPFTGVKIDRSLVNGLEGNALERAEAQIRSIIEMSATTGMLVVAEGIESGGQAQALRRMSCEHAQGFYFARPAEAMVIEEQLNQRAPQENTPAG